MIYSAFFGKLIIATVRTCYSYLSLGLLFYPVYHLSSYW